MADEAPVNPADIRGGELPSDAKVQAEQDASRAKLQSNWLNPTLKDDASKAIDDAITAPPSDPSQPRNQRGRFQQKPVNKPVQLKVEAKAPAVEAVEAPGSEEEITEPLTSANEQADTDAQAGPPESPSDPTPETVEVPYPLMRAGQRNGWSEQEVKDFYAQDPALAERTFSKLHDAYQQIGSRYSMLGQQAQNPRLRPPREDFAAGEQSVEDEPSPQRRTQAQQNDPVRRYFDEHATAALTEQYGEDFTKNVLRPLVRGLESQLRNEFAPYREMQGYFQQQRREANFREMSQFFAQVGKEYQELYGNGHPTDPQHHERLALAKMAGRIRAGALAAGEHISMTEALEQAMYQHAAPHLASLERKKLAGTVKQRAESITLRPNRRAATSERSEPSMKAAGDAYDAKARAIGLL